MAKTKFTAIDKKRAKIHAKLAKGIQRLKAVKPRPESQYLRQITVQRSGIWPDIHETIQITNTGTGIRLGQVYLVLGEVADIRHYILLDYCTGTIVPGMFHLEDFIEAGEDDL